MDTSRQSKFFSTVSLMLGLLVSGSAVFAGPSSVLDPYVEVAPPSGKAAKKQEMRPETTAVETSTTQLNMDGEAKSNPLRIKMHGKSVKPEKQIAAKPKVQKLKTAKTNEPKHANKTASAAGADDGLVGGTKTKIVEGGKSLGDGMASGTKKVGDGITSGAKASGSFFMKGAKVIGGGFKGSDDKADAKTKDPSDTKVSEEKKSRNETKLVAQKKKEDKKDEKKRDKEDDKKKGNGVLTPISNTFKGTVFEIKDGLHAATDKLSLTKPKAGKDSAAARLAETGGKKSKDIAGSSEPTYIAKGKPVKESKEPKSKGASDGGGNGLVSKTLGKLPFIGSKKNSNPEPSVAKKNDSDELLPDYSPRKTADKSESLMNGQL